MMRALFTLAKSTAYGLLALHVARGQTTEARAAYHARPQAEGMEGLAASRS